MVLFKNMPFFYKLRYYGAYYCQMEESQIEKKKSETQRAIEQKAAKRQAVAKTFEKDLYCDF